MKASEGARLIPKDIRDRVYIAHKPININFSFDTLKRIVEKEYSRLPVAGEFFVFFNHRLDKCKILLFREDGWWIFYKRLHKGVFQIEKTKKKEIRVNAAKLVGVIEEIRL